MKNVSKLIDLYKEEEEKEEENGSTKTDSCFPQSSKPSYVLKTVEDGNTSKKTDCKKPYYLESMDEERRKYLERLNNVKPEKVYNDYKPHKRNPTELLLDISEDFIISKRGSWAKLCILDYQEKLLEVIRTNRVVLIRGFTGCGKSTQIPQYLAVDCQNHGQAYNIIVTQPRRVAVKLLATRVAAELNCPLGTLVGYQIGLDRSRDNKATKILYLTPGVLLQRLILSSSLNFVTHIILDEIHERSADMDMLFLLLKKQICERRLNAKLILMSATCDVALFQAYFTCPEEVLGAEEEVSVSPAVFEINGSRAGSTVRRFRQELLYLEDIAGRVGGGGLKFAYVEEDPSKRRYFDGEEFCRANDDTRIIFHREYPTLHRVLYEVVLGLLFHAVEMQQSENQSRGSVLIFLPGLAEIIELTELLRCSPLATRYRWKFFVLHSTVSLKEQTEVLRVAADGSRHLILATNIAESSLTVPNVEFVIDFCLCKTLQLLGGHSGSSSSSLSLDWSSQSSAEQRAGRTGRTNDGTVFRLIPRHFYSTLAPFEVPEFERTPLENYVLKAKLIDERAAPRAVLAYALSPPRLADIEAAVLRLKRVSALTVKICSEGEDDAHYDPEDGHLTTLGYMMALLPLDIALSKLVALGLLFDLTYEATVIAAAHCTSGSFFCRQPASSSASSTTEDCPSLSRYRTQLAWSHRSLSDSLAYLKAYRMYKALEERFRNNATLAQRWCQRNGIDYQRLLELETLVYEVLGRLELNMKIEARVNSRTARPKAEQELLLKVILAGAFYPNYFAGELVERPLLERLQSEVRLEETVVLTGFAKDTATTALYVPALAELYQQSCSPGGIDFRVDGGTVYMRLDAASGSSSELSLDSDEHPLHGAYSAHINAKAASGGGFGGGQQPRTTLKSWSAFAESSVHASVYLALATKRLRWPQVSLSRFQAKAEAHYRRRLLHAIQANYPGGGDAAAAVTSGHFTAKICQTVRRYTLPRTPFPATSVASLSVHITSCSSPSSFALLYRGHSFVERMLANVDLLTRTLHERLKAQNCQTVAEYSAAARSGENFERGIFTGGQSFEHPVETGDLVIAPLKLRQHRSVEGVHNCTATVINGEECIWARAEVLRMSSIRFQKVALIHFIDFGVTDRLPVYTLYPLNCRHRTQVAEEEETRDSFTAEQLERRIDSVQAVHDLLFTIAPLAVHGQLVRVKPSGAVENAGCWAPRAVRYFADYCARHRYAFRAKIVAQVGERLHMELYPLEGDQDQEKELSLNELLVREKLAELKLESEFCQQMSFRREMNRYHEEAAAANGSRNSDQNDPSVEAELIFEGSVPLLSQEFTLSLDTIKCSVLQQKYSPENASSSSLQQHFSQNTFRLRGPTSPLEVKFSGMGRLNATRLAVVSANSINCVALETTGAAAWSSSASQSSYSRLLVAGEVNSSAGDRLSLANTTLMPALLDFAALMALLWAPSVELRVNHLLSRRAFGLPEELCGLLTGVGASDTGASLDPDADIELLCDASLTEEDLALVGLLRYQISQFFYIKGRHISLQTGGGSGGGGGGGMRRLQSSLSIERCLGRRQQACRRTLLQLLTRTRLARNWFERGSGGGGGNDGLKTSSEASAVSPTYRWNMLSDDRWPLAYRSFALRPALGETALLRSLDLKTAVLAPLNVPVLGGRHPQLSSSSSSGGENQPWEDIVLANLDCLEADNLQACQDPVSGLYLCKLCMVATVTGGELAAHCSATLNTGAGHREAGRLFRQYYAIWREERQQVADFVEDALREELAEERLGPPASTGAAEDRQKRKQNNRCKEGEGLSQSAEALTVVKYGEQDYQRSVFSDLAVGVPSMATITSSSSSSSSALAHISKDLYDAPVVLNQEQLSVHLQRQRECKNPYGITAMKRSLDELSERVSRAGGGAAAGNGQSGGGGSSVSIYGSAATIEDLGEYLDDDEISLLDSMHLLTAFKKP